MVMETTDFTNLDHLTFSAGLRSSELRGVFAERQMCAPAVVIGNIRRESTKESALSEHDHVIETLAARMDPMSRSTYALWQGERGAESSCLMLCRPQ
jgi:hypothetical protein